jgi:hypothetical protein
MALKPEWLTAMHGNMVIESQTHLRDDFQKIIASASEFDPLVLGSAARAIHQLGCSLRIRADGRFAFFGQP